MQTVIRQLEELQQRGIAVPPFPTARVPQSLEVGSPSIPLEEVRADEEFQRCLDGWRRAILSLHAQHFPPEAPIADGQSTEPASRPEV